MRTICIVVIHSFTELWKMPVEFLDIRYPGRTCSYLESNLPSNQNFFLWEKSDYSWTKSILHLRIEIRSGWILIPLFKNSLFLYYYLLIIIFHANYKPTFFLDFIFYLFLERGEGKEREGEKHQCVVASRAPPTGDLACSPGKRPDWGSNWWPFGSQACAQSTEPHQPGLMALFNQGIKGFENWIFSQ